MPKPVLRWPVLLALLSVLAVPGCAMFNALHPSNTWKLNRGPAMDTGDVYFSISDPAATLPRDSAE